jgi:hypothetical protein
MRKQPRTTPDAEARILLNLIEDRIRSSEIWVEDRNRLMRLRAVVEQNLMEAPAIATRLNNRLMIAVFRSLRIRRVTPTNATS